jgi:hypothetical protein
MRIRRILNERGCAMKIELPVPIHVTYDQDPQPIACVVLGVEDGLWYGKDKNGIPVNNMNIVNLTPVTSMDDWLEQLDIASQVGP